MPSESCPCSFSSSCSSPPATCLLYLAQWPKMRAPLRLCFVSLQRWVDGGERGSHAFFSSLGGKGESGEPAMKRWAHSSSALASLPHPSISHLEQRQPMPKMGACISTGQPEGQTIPASSSKPASPSTAPVQPTPYQQKAIKALKNMGTKSGPPLKEWTLPVSDDPNVELLVFPLLHFEGYMAGNEGREDGKLDDSAKATKKQTQAAAQQQESKEKVERDKSGRVASFKPLGSAESGAAPEGKADGNGNEADCKVGIAYTDLPFNSLGLTGR